MSPGRDPPDHDQRRLWSDCRSGRAADRSCPAGAPRVITGAGLNEMDDAALREVLGSQEVILARVAPEHKLRIVVACNRWGTSWP